MQGILWAEVMLLKLCREGKIQGDMIRGSVFYLGKDKWHLVNVQYHFDIALTSKFSL